MGVNLPAAALASLQEGGRVVGGSCRRHPHFGLHHVPLGRNVQAAGVLLTFTSIQAALEALPAGLCPSRASLAVD